MSNKGAYNDKHFCLFMFLIFSHFRYMFDVFCRTLRKYPTIPLLTYTSNSFRYNSKSAGFDMNV